MVTKSKVAAVSNLPVHVFPFDKPGLPFFETQHQFTGLFHVHDVWNMILDCESLPPAGLSSTYICDRGFVWCHIVEIADVLDKGCCIVSLKQYFDIINRDHVEKMPCFGLTPGRALFVPFGYVAIMIGVSNLHSDTTPIAYTQIPILENASMDNVSELAQGEVKAYVTKNISRKLKVFREPSNLKAFNTYMNTCPISKDDPASLSPREGDIISPLLAPSISRVCVDNPQG